ncbi:hypothetical protein [Saccharothrix obliqua]|uniref:hypothetical protein n=1 Tax=Saccharothrix obliqua TaxID=2861747 RepID=UPI001C5F759D|nr:hypothetical protein [Saccharothrix obliqua]MBW4719558.1 hypothetical protein [Saccharothrix obliqua]
MADVEEELRRVLAERAADVRSSLSGPAIRARAAARRAAVRRIAPLVTAAAVLLVVVTALGLAGRGTAPVEPATRPVTTAPPTPPSVTERTTSRPTVTSRWLTTTTAPTSSRFSGRR